ncbi:MAG: hypothetical protein AOA65_1713 [Candidatus Bathyarchaeota archaeon BA1]|nr:MAG: hypothetical protein AOA65_1713 [Candidatus Bathyarchaeota archaeon BA1]
MAQIHHIQSPIGEDVCFRCPHCGKEIIVRLRALEGDPDTVEVYWGKDSKEIEEKQKKTEEEIEEELYLPPNNLF